MRAKILIADDEATIRNTLSAFLAEEGHETITAASGEEALKLISQVPFDALITDIRMPGMSGIELLRRSKALRPEIPVLIITAYAALETAVEALREGASDYIIKPFILDDILYKIRKSLRVRELKTDKALLRKEVDDLYDFSNIIGQSRKIQELLSVIKKVASSSGTVLISGESGTGKELVARAIHNSSSRKEKRFIAVNCCAIPETLLDSTLFGHLRGAFTDAMEDRKGLFETANEGTLFLDEIGDLPIGLQTKLLRAIEEKEVLPLGATTPVPVNIRLIAATHCDLLKGIQDGTFREDLYYRLNVVGIKLPPLRERTEDIPLLVEHFIRKYNRELNKDFSGATSATMQILMQYPWKGNIRELENVIERGMILGTAPRLRPEDLPAGLIDGGSGAAEKYSDNLKAALRNFEQRHIKAVLEKTGQSKQIAASRLGVSLATLYRKLEKES